MLRSKTPSTDIAGMHALLIGIDQYLHNNIVSELVERVDLQNARRFRDLIGGPDLSGAVADARSTYQYLVEHLQIPTSQIHLLLNQDATRARILQELRNLATDPSIEHDTPILIYYAGHGGSGIPPDDWYNEGVMMQCLIPYDFNTTESSSDSPFKPRTYTNRSGTSQATHLDVYGIPDRTLGLLLDTIAASKGDNITVILDCCHSGSGTRDFGANNFDMSNLNLLDAVPRGIRGLVPIPKGLDSDIQSATGRARGALPSTGRVGQGSHILLSACGSNEQSWELRGRGLFTQALLRALQEVSIDSPITYSDLLDRISHFMARGITQNPQCEGLQRDRYLFQKKRAMRGSVFQVRRYQNRYVMHAGEGHGITKDSEFDLHSYDRRTLSGASLCIARPLHVGVFLTELDVPHDHLTELFSVGLAYQVRVGLEEAFRVYVSPDRRLEELRRHISGHDSPLPGISITRILLSDDPEGAGLCVYPDSRQGHATLELRMPSSTPIARTMRVVHSVPVTDLGATARVLHYAARYSWHLRRQSSPTPLSRAITLAFTELRPSQDEYDDDLSPALKPTGDNLIFEGLVKLQLDSTKQRLYGLKITNRWRVPLYVAAFLFDSDLSIMTYYLPSAAPIGKKADAPLPAATDTEPGVLTIGYGASGFSPFQYVLQDNLDTELSFLRVFVSTKYMDLAFISQEAPFEGEALKNDEAAEQAAANEFSGAPRGGASPVAPETASLWHAITIPILQTRKYGAVVH